MKITRMCWISVFVIVCICVVTYHVSNVRENANKQYQSDLIQIHSSLNSIERYCQAHMDDPTSEFGLLVIRELSSISMAVDSIYLNQKCIDTELRSKLFSYVDELNGVFPTLETAQKTMCIENVLEATKSFHALFEDINTITPDAFANKIEQFINSICRYPLTTAI